MIRTLSLTFALTAAVCAQAAPKPTRIPDAALKIAEGLRERALADDTAWNFIEGLTTEIGPRLAAGDNDAKAREWVIAKFKALGFDKVWTEPVTYPKWVRHSEHAALTAPFAQPLAVSALGDSPATPNGGIDAEVVGFASLDALKAAPDASVRGKIVYVGPRMHATKDGGDYGKIGSPVRTKGPALASQKGAVAYLLRSAGTDDNRLPHTGVTDFEHVTPIPAAALSNPDADLLERVLKRGTTTLRLALDCGIEGTYTGANVIGEIEGRGQPSDYFLMGGHLDSWDPGTGAIDDAAGIAIAAGAAHLIKELPQWPRRSIRVVAFANEEAGLFGGKAYADAHAKDIARAVLGSESDLGADRIYQITASVEPFARDAVSQIADALKPLGVVYDANTPGHGGSDLSAVHAVGMAAVSLHQDATRYFDWHHTANDTLDKIDPEQLRQNVAVYAVVAYLAAQADGEFGSAPGAFAADTTE